MLFQSYVFILLFFPLCLTGFWLLSQRGKTAPAQLWLIGFSLWFYAWANPAGLTVLAGSIAVNYALCRRLEGIGDRTADTAARRRRILWLGIGFNAALLFYFKYFDFFVDNLNAVFRTDWTFSALLWPLGISFFTFQQIGYLVDVYRKEERCCSLREYVLFVSCFAYVSSGPIVTAQEMLPRFRAIGQKRLDPEQFTGGLYLFVLGLGKKVLLADTFGEAVGYGYGNAAALSGTDALLVMLFYTLQLYFDFSGYCDMAVGIGKMVGIEVAENFDSPFKSASVKEFWRRWHMTLGRFFTRYVYIPLGGSRRGKVRTLCNVMIIMLLSGLWHGAAWTFVLWGFLHGLGMMWDNLRRWELPKKWMNQALTFAYVCLTFVFFRAESIGQGLLVIRKMFSFEWNGFLFEMAQALELSEVYIVTKALSMKLPQLLPWFWLGMLLLLCAVCAAVLSGKKAGDVIEGQRKGQRLYPFLLAVLFVWSLISMTGVSEYLYFSF